MRLKVEINTREHFTVLGIDRHAFTVENPWFRGEAVVPAYELEELLGTKMRALYQRKKGRDLFDLWLALNSTDADLDLIVNCFRRYLDHEGAAVSRALFETNLSRKLGDRSFLEDTRFLIPADVGFDPLVAARLVQATLIARLPGEPWKGVGSGR
jgi:predicted nucleotidyltransferase component of viral defense system